MTETETTEDIYVLEPDERHTFGVLFIEAESPADALDSVSGIGLKDKQWRIKCTMDEYIEQVRRKGQMAEVYTR